jgi:hypothetical protein
MSSKVGLFPNLNTKTSKYGVVELLINLDVGYNEREHMIDINVDEMIILKWFIKDAWFKLYLLRSA